jgi:hypothetical protein
MEFFYPLFYYWLAAFSIAIYRQWTLGKLSLTNKIAFCVPILVFYISDILLNYTVLQVMGSPPGKTITERMAFYRAYDTGWRGHTGTFLCQLLDEVDPSGVHCDKP